MVADAILDAVFWEILFNINFVATRMVLICDYESTLGVKIISVYDQSGYAIPIYFTISSSYFELIGLDLTSQGLFELVSSLLIN